MKFCGVSERKGVFKRMDAYVIPVICIGVKMKSRGKKIMKSRGKKITKSHGDNEIKGMLNKMFKCMDVCMIFVCIYVCIYICMQYISLAMSN